MQINNLILMLTIVTFKTYAASISNTGKSITTLHHLWQNEWGPVPENPSDPVTIIFYKYARDPKLMTMEEFEVLFNCSTGSSCQMLPPNVTRQTPFRLLTDCDINSALSNENCDLLNRCMTGREILTTIFPSNDTDKKSINEAQLRELLPLVFYQSQSQFCNDIVSEEEIITGKPTSAEVWGYGFLFVTIISGLSLAGVSVLPLMAKEFYQKLLTVLIGLAVGSLAASAAFHLIPQAFKLTLATDGNHEYLFISLWILCGIYLFFMIERILKIIVIAQKWASKGFPDSTSSQAIVQDVVKNVHTQDELQESGGVDSNSYNSNSQRRLSGDSRSIYGESSSCNDIRDVSHSFCNPNNVELIYASQQQAIKASFGHEQKPEKTHSHTEITFRQGEDSVIATVAWMIIFGDGFHNFIDGVSIGAAFQQSILTGISISLAVMCEELPHELGDFAVLLNSGMTMKQAVFYNFLSATTCYLGMIVGIVIGEFTQKSTYIFALAGGMFLYISLVDMLPEMNETGNKAASKSLLDVFKVLLLQTFGMLLGVFSLFFLAYYQDSLTFAN